MVEALITALIYIAIMALVVYLILWVFQLVGVSLPEKVVQIIWVIFALVCILVLFRTLGVLGGGRLLF